MSQTWTLISRSKKQKCITQKATFGDWVTLLLFDETMM
jgi:hypothetical protein